MVGNSTFLLQGSFQREAMNLKAPHKMGVSPELSYNMSARLTSTTGEKVKPPLCLLGDNVVPKLRGVLYPGTSVSKSLYHRTTLLGVAQ